MTPSKPSPDKPQRIHDVIYAIEWHWKHDPTSWRHWAIRFTERAARKWIEREEAKHKNMKFRVVEFIRMTGGSQ